MRRTGLTFALLILPVLLVTACGSGGSGAADPSSPASVAAGGWTSYSLYTHCGIEEANVGGRWYRAEKPLSDGNGNPPAGWGNPYQAGRIRVAGSDRVEFRDDAGHDVIFILGPGASTPAKICS
jgi:hypothetical protein